MDSINPQENMQLIFESANKIIKKLRTKIDRKNFCLENSKCIYIIYRFVYNQDRTRL